MIFTNCSKKFPLFTVTSMATPSNNEPKCVICLELFQDPRNLPCLHTFCRKCIQRSLNEENHSLKCPVCSEKHELSEGAGLLPVNEFVLEELRIKRLDQQQQDNNGQQIECKLCRQVPAVASCTCEDCDGAKICQPCASQHENFTGHLSKKPKLSTTTEDNSSEPTDLPEKQMFSKCPRHSNELLRFLCTSCSEVVCSDCLLLGSHKEHDRCLVTEARRYMESEMKDWGSEAEKKKQEFSEFLEKVAKAQEYRDLMETEVKRMFDSIAESVEAQKNEALQSVSQGLKLKEIWAQKDLVEINLAQIDSFTRVADQANKCTSDASYVSMAAQCVKLMRRLKDTHGDEQALDQSNKMVIGSDTLEGPSHAPVDRVLSFGHPSLKFSPAPGSTIKENEVIKVSLVVGCDLPVICPLIDEKCQLVVKAKLDDHFTIKSNVKFIQSHPLSWEISPLMHTNKYGSKLMVQCQFSREFVNVTEKADYTIAGRMQYQYAFVKITGHKN